MIEIKNFWWKYFGKKDWALKNINLLIRPYESVGIIGANENGKTTLARALIGLIPHRYRGIMKGEILLENRHINEYSLSEITQKIGFVFSDPESQFTSMSVEEELVFGLENLNLSLKEIKQRIEWCVNLFNIKKLLKKPPYELSGGQKQLIAIASVVIMKPEILILDEPTSMLDPAGKYEVFKILKKLNQEENITLIIVEHNLDALFKIVKRIVYLKENRIYKDLPLKEFIKIIHKYTKDFYYKQ